MDFLYEGASVRAFSTGAVGLYQHLGPAQHHLLRLGFALCWNALGLGNELLAGRQHYYPREIRDAHCWKLARSHRWPITFEVWTCQGTWFWYVVNPQRNGGAIGAASTGRDGHAGPDDGWFRPKTHHSQEEDNYDSETSTGGFSADRRERAECLRLKSKPGGTAARSCYRA